MTCKSNELNECARAHSLIAYTYVQKETFAHENVENPRKKHTHYVVMITSESSSENTENFWSRWENKKQKKISKNGKFVCIHNFSRVSLCVRAIWFLSTSLTKNRRGKKQWMAFGSEKINDHHRKNKKNKKKNVNDMKNVLSRSLNGEQPYRVTIHRSRANSIRYFIVELTLRHQSSKSIRKINSTIEREGAQTK